MKKVISYSLWGDKPKYTIGAIKNAELANNIYPGWISRFYIGNTVPNNIVDIISSIPNTELIFMDSENNWKAMFWRFTSCYDETVDISIFRDTDSRLSMREKYAVDEWLKSNKTFHIMRDHPYHRYPMLGGMWGYKKNNAYDIKTLLNNFNTIDSYGTDYQFFIEKLYPLIGNDKVVHDEFFDKKPFPKPRENKEFVGDVFDENNIRHLEYQKFIQ